MLKVNQIYNMDCLEGMKLIADKSIDMILCDLPYGITQNKWDELIPLTDYVVNGKRILHKEDYLLQKYKEGVNYKESLESWEREHKKGLWYYYNKIIKDDGMICLTATQPFATQLINSNEKLFKYDLIWDKKLPTGFLNAKRQPLRRHELILCFYKKMPVYNPIMRKGKQRSKGGKLYSLSDCYGTINQPKEKEIYDEYYPTSIIEIGNANQKGKIHPTQKPVELFEWLIKTYTNENETVLDNCMGSGTTAIACINTNRNFIGFELSSEYCEIANRRLKEVL